MSIVRVLLSCCFLAALLLASTSASARTQAVVEVRYSATRWVEPDRLRRLVSLELGEVDVPPPHDASSIDPQPAVYIRVLADGDQLLVQLWDRGELEGQRRLLPKGGQQLLARRVALVSAELARKLTLRRVRAAAKARRLERANQRKRRQLGSPVRTVLAAGAQLRGAGLGLGDAWLFGTAIQARLRFNDSAQLGLALAGLTGPTTGVDGAAATRWIEVSVQPSYAFGLTQTGALKAGVEVAAATVHIGGIQAIDDVDGANDSWSSRAAITLTWQQRLGPALWFEAGPEAGLTLRSVPLSDETGRRKELGGLWLGLRAGAEVSVF